MTSVTEKGKKLLSTALPSAVKVAVFCSSSTVLLWSDKMTSSLQSAGFHSNADDHYQAEHGAWNGHAVWFGVSCDMGLGEKRADLEGWPQRAKVNHTELFWQCRARKMKCAKRSSVWEHLLCKDNNVKWQLCLAALLFVSSTRTMLYHFGNKHSAAVLDSW